jgi:hypothetical protein
MHSWAVKAELTTCPARVQSQLIQKRINRRTSLALVLEISQCRAELQVRKRRQMADIERCSIS